MACMKNCHNMYHNICTFPVTVTSGMVNELSIGEDGEVIEPVTIRR